MSVLINSRTYGILTYKFSIPQEEILRKVEIFCQSSNAQLHHTETHYTNTFNDHP